MDSFPWFSFRGSYDQAADFWGLGAVLFVTQQQSESEPSPQAPEAQAPGELLRNNDDEDE